MARDYKNRRSPPPGKGGSCWLWLVTGLAVGLLVALFTYLSVHPPAHSPMAQAPPSPAPRQADGANPAREPATPAPPAEAPAARPRFEFYSILPEMEVPVSTETLPARGTREPPKEDGSYLLQVGSFRGADEAERLKANLALLGMEAAIQTVSVDGRQTWHRVRIGPFSSLREAYGVRDRLAREELEAIVLKVSS